MNESPSLLEDLQKFRYKGKEIGTMSAPTQDSSKMKALIGEVHGRWQKQIETQQPTQKSTLDKEGDISGNEEDKEQNKSDNDEEVERISLTTNKVSSIKQKPRSDDRGSGVSSDDDEYEPSSGNSSDSETREWLSKEKLKAREARKRATPYYRSIQENVKRRRVGDSDDESSTDGAERLMRCKNSFDVLKQLRMMRQKKATAGIDDEYGSHSANGHKEGNESSVDQSDASTSQAALKCKIEEKKLVNEKSTFTFNRKRLVLDSDSDDEDNSKMAKKETDLAKIVTPLLSPTKLKRKVLISSDEEGGENEETNNQSGSEDLFANDESSRDSLENSSKPRKLDSEECQEKAVEFFNEASMEELVNVPRSSERIADALIYLRPFDDYENLIEAVKNAKVKGLNTLLVEGYVELLELQNDLDRLLHSCADISKNLTSAVTDLLNGANQPTGQPTLIPQSLEMKPYQIIGLNWLILMDQQNLNAILADEMGLGKTVQVIALLAYFLEKKIPGPHLIVVPSSTMDNWLNELRRWCPSLKVLTYYGSMEDRKFLRNEYAEGRQNDFDVILSTYRVVTSSNDDKSFLKRLKINYSVFDEAHMLKSCTTARYRCLMKIRSNHRLLLTGTPLQNNLVELMSLMHFVMPKLFNEHTENLRDILNLFQCRSLKSYEQEKIEQAKSIMQPFVLRRLKSEVLSQLPKKHERVEYCELSEGQLELYGSLMSECAEAVNRNENGFSNSDARCFLMQLRKAANHPLLLRRMFDDGKLKKMATALCKSRSHSDSDPRLVIEDMSVMSDFELTRMCNQYKCLTRFKLPAKFVAASAKFQVLDKILPEVKSEGSKVLLFSQFTLVLDIMEEFMHQRKYKYLRLDGSTPVVERQILIDKFNTSPDLFIFLLSTRAGGLGINLTSANVIVLHDIDYNPYNDRQAEDRCHRVGQTKEVTVIRLIAKNTIDESMLACAQRKLMLEKQVTGDQEDDEDPKDIESLLRQALNM